MPKSVPPEHELEPDVEIDPANCYATHSPKAPQHRPLQQKGFFLPGRAYVAVVPVMFAAIRIETVLAVLVILNLVGLTIAAYVVLRRK